MRKRAKVYLPRWIRWFMLALLAGIWVVILRVTFFAPPSAGAPEPFEFAIATAVLLMVAVVLWLGSGRLPMYEVVIEDDEEPPARR